VVEALDEAQEREPKDEPEREPTHEIKPETVCMQPIPSQAEPPLMLHSEPRKPEENPTSPPGDLGPRNAQLRSETDSRHGLSIIDGVESVHPQVEASDGSATPIEEQAPAVKEME
ncbi:hypothetical protein CYMTET_19201, partial [Cymbomonas tetramitiformis]